MAERKKSWQRVKLGDVVTNSTAATKDYEADGFSRYIIGKHIPEDGRISEWSPVGDGDFGSRIRTIVRAGDVICTTRGPKLRVAVATFDCLSAHTNFILRPLDEGVILPSLVEAVARSEGFQDHLRRNFRGSTNLFVNWSDAARYEFSLPPLDEQRRMAAVLDAARETTEAVQHTARAALQVRRSLQKGYFLDAHDEANTTVGQIADVRNGTTPRRGRDEYWGGDVAWLPTGKVNERKITAADEFITEKALSECSLDLIPASSTLIAMIGQGKTRGMAAFLSFEATINQNFAAVVPGNEVEPEFLFYQLEAKYQLLRLWSQGTNQQALNCRLVSAFPFWVPSVQRQREIVDVLRTADLAHEQAEGRATMAWEALGMIRESILAGGPS
ncbi:MAG: restriction endonuclease subunit S [Polyangiaceae bacterium]|nr:restriction endonuclease subunit S [Polyangiaceae bacterium]